MLNARKGDLYHTCLSRNIVIITAIKMLQNFQQIQTKVYTENSLYMFLFINGPIITSLFHRKCTYKRQSQARSCNNYCSGRAINITHSECVFVALVSQHAMRMRSVILSSVTCPALQYFSALFHKRHDFRKQKTYGTQNVWFDFLYNFVLNSLFINPYPTNVENRVSS